MDNSFFFYPYGHVSAADERQIGKRAT